MMKADDAGHKDRVFALFDHQIRLIRALTVPYMMTTATLDRNAFIFHGLQRQVHSRLLKPPILGHLGFARAL